MEDFLYSHIGKKIREAREIKQWTQQDLSDRMHLTRSSIANIELGRQKIQVHVLYDFSRILGISPFDLLPQPIVIEKPNKIVLDGNFDKESLSFFNLIVNNQPTLDGGDET